MVKVIKISNFLKFLLPPTPVHSATPGPCARVSGFSIVSAMVHVIFISQSFTLVAGICSKMYVSVALILSAQSF